MTKSLPQYKARVDRGELLEDPRQLVLLRKFEELGKKLESNQPPVANKSFFSKLFSTTSR